MGRIADAGDVADTQKNDCLSQTQQHLVNHMGDDVGRDMHAGTMLALGDRPFPADDLDGVEETVPDTDTDERETAAKRPLLGLEQIVADSEGYQAGNDGSHRQRFPVILVEEHAQKLAKADADLGDPAAVSDRFTHDLLPPFL